MGKRLSVLAFIGIICVPLFSEGIGADAAAPRIAAGLASLQVPRGSIRILTKEETRAFIALAAELKINIFELLDGAYRYASPAGIRFVLSGAALRSASASFDLGGERVEALLPIGRIVRVEFGERLADGQEAMDVYLDGQYSGYIELGTAVMDSRFGFRRIGPLAFADAYGVKVKRFPFATELERLELYAPGKGAIYVKALNRPKRWNLRVVKIPGNDGIGD